ncbi:unnamed protein product [Pleuronectes platessa]|uniref:Uncharacterized protein n=1 Tax=Pleuronectes platessa TaxID=8262 RepID=A0A9N7VU73_PLEPL|nr:unnamed protein product [Pleuronectes platessa]
MANQQAIVVIVKEEGSGDKRRVLKQHQEEETGEARIVPKTERGAGEDGKTKYLPCTAVHDSRGHFVPLKTQRTVPGLSQADATKKLMERPHPSRSAMHVPLSAIVAVQRFMSGLSPQPAHRHSPLLLLLLLLLLFSFWIYVSQHCSTCTLQF